MWYTQSMNEELLNWYRKTARKLPWRVMGAKQKPYAVWISEVMLQQTRAEAVIPYYLRFMEALPDVKALAEVPLDALYKLWEGLGYYSRVRNLQKTARILMEKYHAELPADFDALLKLPGIGDYTAGAIASIAFGIPVPAVDGNVLRVWSRLTGDARDILDEHTRKDIRSKVQAEIPADSPGDFNQALMELGATLCGPNTVPDCEHCPLKTVCVGCRDGTAHLLPNRSPKPERRVEEWTLFVLHCNGKTALVRRPAKGVLSGQWALPGVQKTMNSDEALGFLSTQGINVECVYPCPASKHLFTHIEWRMTAWQTEIESMEMPEIPGVFWLSREEVENAAIPSAYRAYRDML